MLKKKRCQYNDCRSSATMFDIHILNVYLTHIDIFTIWQFVICTRRYDTQSYFNVRSKADITQLNLPDGNKLKKWDKETKKGKTDMLLSIGKQSKESVESVLKKKRQATGLSLECDLWMYA